MFKSAHQHITVARSIFQKVFQDPLPTTISINNLTSIPSLADYQDSLAPSPRFLPGTWQNSQGSSVYRPRAESMERDVESYRSSSKRRRMSVSRNGREYATTNDVPRHVADLENNLRGNEMQFERLQKVSTNGVHPARPTSNVVYPGDAHRRSGGELGREHSHSSNGGSDNDLDEVLLDAASARASSSFQPQLHSSRPQQPFLPKALTRHQTHVFTAPVTGAPLKKPRYSASSGALLGTQVPVSASPSASGLNSSASFIPSTTTSPYPPQNNLGQRICRQCGQPGRYKDGKCVEKWGPGPAGPGTACDRCRKKIKRVERRGTVGDFNTPGGIPNHLAGGVPPLTGMRASPGKDRDEDDVLAALEMDETPMAVRPQSAEEAAAELETDISKNQPESQSTQSASLGDRTIETQPDSMEIDDVSHAVVDAVGDEDAEGEMDADAEGDPEIRDADGDLDPDLLEAVDAAEASGKSDG